MTTDKIRKSLIGYTYNNWTISFHKDKGLFMEHQFPAIYKERKLIWGGMRKVRITIEEI